MRIPGSDERYVDTRARCDGTPSSDQPFALFTFHQLPPHCPILSTHPSPLLQLTHFPVPVPTAKMPEPELPRKESGRNPHLYWTVTARTGQDGTGRNRTGQDPDAPKAPLPSNSEQPTPPRTYHMHPSQEPRLLVAHDAFRRAPSRYDSELFRHGLGDCCCCRATRGVTC